MATKLEDLIQTIIESGRGGPTTNMAIAKATGRRPSNIDINQRLIENRELNRALKLRNQSAILSNRRSELENLVFESQNVQPLISGAGGPISPGPRNLSQLADMLTPGGFGGQTISVLPDNVDIPTPSPGSAATLDPNIPSLISPGTANVERGQANIFSIGGTPVEAEELSGSVLELLNSVTEGETGMSERKVTAEKLKIKSAQFKRIAEQQRIRGEKVTATTKLLETISNDPKLFEVILNLITNRQEAESARSAIRREKELDRTSRGKIADLKLQEKRLQSTSLFSIEEQIQLLKQESEVR